MLLRTITESEMINSLTNLNLWYSANFNSDLSVNYLALMLAKAQNLKFIDISRQIVKRREIEV